MVNTKNNFSKLRGNLRQNHKLAKYTSWKIGGEAEYFYEPADLEDLKFLLQTWKENPITILGAATNVLIRDKGIKGLVIYLRNRLNKLKILDSSNTLILHIEAGVSLASLLQKCMHFGAINAAFMAGIPGTIGGALKMNAGANGGCIWNHVIAVETINRFAEVRLRQAEEFTANYRKVTGLAEGEWFAAALLNFELNTAHCDIRDIKQQISDYLQKRKNTQPLDLPSCGSVFRNPEGHYAAKLIEASGLKGRQIGAAKVSEKHANFIVNCGNASSDSIEALIQEIIFVVKKYHKIELVPEVHVLGEK